MSSENYASVERFGVRKNTIRFFADPEQAMNFAVSQSRYARNRNVLYKVTYYDHGDKVSDRYFNGERRF